MSTKSTHAEKPGRSRGAVWAALALSLALLFLLGGIGRIVWGIELEESSRITKGIVAIVISVVLASMIRFVPPGHAHVVRFFGRYVGTNRRTGLALLPPLAYSTKIDVRPRKFETKKISLNDLNGNAVPLSAIITWQVADTAKATFAVENVEELLPSQARTALRRIIAAQESGQPDSAERISRELREELSERVKDAGLEVVEACVFLTEDA